MGITPDKGESALYLEKEGIYLPNYRTVTQKIHFLGVGKNPRDHLL